MSTNYVPNPASLPVTYVKVLSNRQDEDIQTGRTKPPLFTCETPQSIVLVVDGKTRTVTMDPFNFRVSISNNLFRARMIRVTKVVIPKPPNITKFNNNLCFKAWNGFDVVLGSLIIPPAFYNTTTLSNTMASLMTAEANLLFGPGHVFVVSFDSVTRSFSVTFTYNGVLRPFFFANDCSFIRRGEFLAHFFSFDLSEDPEVVGASTQRSNVAGMMYSRYAIVSSESLNQYSFSDSRATTLLVKNNIICVVDMTSVYDADDYDVGIPYSGVFTAVSTPDAPHIMVTNPQRNMNDKIDITVQDEYGDSFNEVMDLDAPGGEVSDRYPDNTLGISLWMEVLF